MTRPGPAVGYSAPQLATLRRVIAGLPSLDPETIAERDRAVHEGQCSQQLWPLWPVAQLDASLWATLQADRRIDRFSVYGLFPAAYPMVYGGGAPETAGQPEATIRPETAGQQETTIRYDGRTRGRVAIISDGADAVVIKPGQSSREAEIAALAGELGIGPRQLATVPGFISEEFCDGPFLTDLAPAAATPERMAAIGAALAAGLTRLHQAGICYNDATVADPEGRSHLIVQPDGAIRIIDFGVSLLLDKHPEGLSFEDAWNAARTDPFFRLFRQMSGDAGGEALGRFVAEYGRRLAGQSAAEIQARDWRIAGEGIAIIAARFGSQAADALRQGLNQAG